MSGTTIASGSVLDRKYHLIRRIGGGGMGTVFEAEDLESGTACAVKVMRVGGDQRREEARSAREARLAGFIEHPNVVRVRDVGVHDEPPCSFLVMELLHGEDLGARSARLGPLSPKEVAWILREAASALDAAHERQIVHRDLKPTNLFLELHEREPRLKILDFGTAKMLDDTTSSETTHSLGTPIYMAPEQFQAQVPTPAVDIFGIGMTAFRLLTGHHFYELETSQCPNTFALGARLMRGVPEGAKARAHRYDAGLPAGFDPWFERATARDADARFATASGAAEAFREALEVTPALDPSSLIVPEPAPSPAVITERPPSLETADVDVPIRPPPRRAPWLGLGLLGLVAAGLWFARPKTSPTPWLRSDLASAMPNLSPKLPPPTPTTKPRPTAAPSTEPAPPKAAVPAPSPKTTPSPAARPSRADLWTRE